MGDQPKTVTVTASVPEDLYQTLLELAEARGVSANTVLLHAIQTEKYLDDSEAEGGKLLIEKPDRSFTQLVHTKGARKKRPT